MHGIANQLRDIKTELEEEREQKQTEQRTQLEERKDELQQTEAQKMRLEVNRPTQKTQFERDLAAKEEGREDKKRGMAKLLGLNRGLEEIQQQRNESERSRRQLQIKLDDLVNT